ncbi:MAG TPA: D-aminoacylase [Gemmatimonadales bacterium]|nr:D-aminoacylase [Gemmatimonadales bacterium]
MGPRALIWLAGAALCAAACDRPAATGRRGGPGDVLLRGGWIVDGSGNPRYRGDLLIRGDRIDAVGRLESATARETLDVSGKVVAPGFIDMLGQSEQNVLIDNRVLSKITQGVTTEVTGEGGSAFPLTDSLVAQDSDVMKKYHFAEDWRDLDGYFRHLEKTGSTINIATFVGATQLRTVVVGTGDRPATPAELAHMSALVDTAMEQGALGVSTALEYAPAFYAPTDELIALARAAQRHGGIYATHMRNEGGQEDAALDETFRIGRETGIPLEIWHLKVSGRLNWGRMPKVLAKIDSARRSGLDVTANLYPYIAAATSLDASIPAWAHSGGTDSMLARLKDPATRASIRAELLAPPQITDRFMRAAGGPPGVIVLPFADSLSRFTGKRLSEIATLRHEDPIETLFDLVTIERGRTGAIYFIMNEPDVDTALATWWTSFDTDYGGVAPDGPFGHDGVHPRTYGTFARILGRYVRDLHLLPLESAVRKMTSLPAQRVGLMDRGLLRPGMFADVTVFDPDSIADRATFEAPHQPSVGVTYVFVNGQMVLNHGQVTAARPGRGLRGPGYRPRSGR